MDSATGQKKEVLPSSFKQAPEFRKATAEEVSMLEVASVYRLPGAQLSPGALYVGTFNYRDGVERNDAAIVSQRARHVPARWKNQKAGLRRNGN